MTLQSPTATLTPLISSSELTGCGYPGLLDRKNRSDMCPRGGSNPRLPACKASTLSTRPGSPPSDFKMNDEHFKLKNRFSIYFFFFFFVGGGGGEGGWGSKMLKILKNSNLPLDIQFYRKKRNSFVNIWFLKPG